MGAGESAKWKPACGGTSATASGSLIVARVRPPAPGAQRRESSHATRARARRNTPTTIPTTPASTISATATTTSAMASGISHRLSQRGTQLGHGGSGEVCSSVTSPPGGAYGGAGDSAPLLSPRSRSAGEIAAAPSRRCSGPSGRVMRRKVGDSARCGRRLAATVARTVRGLAVTLECSPPVRMTASTSSAPRRCFLCTERIAARAICACRSRALASSTPCTCFQADAKSCATWSSTTRVPKPAAARVRGSRLSSLTSRRGKGRRCCGPRASDRRWAAQPPGPGRSGRRPASRSPRSRGRPAPAGSRSCQGWPRGCPHCRERAKHPAARAPRPHPARPSPRRPPACRACPPPAASCAARASPPRDSKSPSVAVLKPKLW